MPLGRRLYEKQNKKYSFMYTFCYAYAFEWL